MTDEQYIILTFNICTEWKCVIKYNAIERIAKTAFRRDSDDTRLHLVPLKWDDYIFFFLYTSTLGHLRYRQHTLPMRYETKSDTDSFFLLSYIFAGSLRG